MVNHLRAAPPNKLEILILGGTCLIGPALVEVAKPRGHRLTLFNRGKAGRDMFPDIERIRGNRDGKIDGLKGRKWDVVIDNSGYVPRHVRLTAELLKPSVSTYVFISTISVYSEQITPNQDETGPRAVLPPGRKDTEKVSPDTYGALKAECEDVVAAIYAGRVLTIRPGLIVGPRDPTDRFTYWPVRCDRGGAILAPGDGNDPVQFIDVRDLAKWVIGAVEAGTTGVYNAVGPARKLTMKELLAACQKAATKKGRLVWAPTVWLDEHKVQPWRDMPAWIPGTALTQLSSAKAIAKGMTFRPIDETIRDTRDWWKTLSDDRRTKLKAGLAPEREKELLAGLAKTK